MSHKDTTINIEDQNVSEEEEEEHLENDLDDSDDCGQLLRSWIKLSFWNFLRRIVQSFNIILNVVKRGWYNLHHTVPREQAHWPNLSVRVAQQRNKELWSREENMQMSQHNIFIDTDEYDVPKQPMKRSNYLLKELLEKEEATHQYFEKLKTQQLGSKKKQHYGHTEDNPWPQYKFKEYTLYHKFQNPPDLAKELLRTWRTTVNRAARHTRNINKRPPERSDGKPFEDMSYADWVHTGRSGRAIIQHIILSTLNVVAFANGAKSLMHSLEFLLYFATEAFMVFETKDWDCDSNTRYDSKTASSFNWGILLFHLTSFSWYAAFWLQYAVNTKDNKWRWAPITFAIFKIIDMCISWTTGLLQNFMFPIGELIEKNKIPDYRMLSRAYDWVLYLIDCFALMVCFGVYWIQFAPARKAHAARIKEKFKTSPRFANYCLEYVSKHDGGKHQMISRQCWLYEWSLFVKKIEPEYLKRRFENKGKKVSELFTKEELDAYCKPGLSRLEEIQKTSLEKRLPALKNMNVIRERVRHPQWFQRQKIKFSAKISFPIKKFFFRSPIARLIKLNRHTSESAIIRDAKKMRKQENLRKRQWRRRSAHVLQEGREQPQIRLDFDDTLELGGMNYSYYKGFDDGRIDAGRNLYFSLNDSYVYKEIYD